MPLDNIWDLAIDHAKQVEKEEKLRKDSVMLVVGSKNGGKTTLCNKFVEKNDILKPTIALEYAFGRRSRTFDMDKDVCHIWELGGGTVFSDLLTIPITEKNILNLNLILVLDLSVPTELWFTAETLLNAVKNQIDSVIENSSDPNLRQQLEDLIASRFENSVEKPENSFPVPLMIVGTKYDSFQDIESEKRKLICKCLRYMALFHGAILMFVSNRSDNQMSKLRLFLSHMVFKTTLNNTPNFDYNKPLVVLLGSDSSELIGPLPDPYHGSRNIDVESLDMAKNCFVSIFPQVESKNVIPEDPGLDPNFQERDIDLLKNQKDQELKEYGKVRKQKKAIWD